VTGWGHNVSVWMTFFPLRVVPISTCCGLFVLCFSVFVMQVQPRSKDET
jgi:hypothetical protein